MAEAFQLGGVEVPAGTRASVDLPITDLSTHTPITMPVVVIHGRKPGPRLFVCAALHGDEINGVEIIRRLLQLSALKRLRGTLIAVPIVIMIPDHMVGVFLIGSLLVPQPMLWARALGRRASGGMNRYLLANEIAVVLIVCFAFYVRLQG